MNFIVPTYSAVAKSTSLLESDAIEATEDLGHLNAIVKHACLQLQELCSNDARSVWANPCRGNVVGGRPSCSATPVGYFRDIGGEHTAPGATKTRAHQLLQDMKRPNGHAALHYSRTAAEYGPPGLLDVLIGEDKHRYFGIIPLLSQGLCGY